MKSVLLLRGINVGGHGKLPMAELRALLEGLGAEDVATYIQSGNVVMRGAPRSDEIADAIEEQFGFRPTCMLIGAEAFAEGLANDPFKEARETPKLLHYFFCADEPHPNRQKLDALLSGAERYEIIGKVMYFHAPDGMGRSKFGARAESHLGVSATARNLNTVAKLREMLDAI